MHIQVSVVCMCNTVQMYESRGIEGITSANC